MLIFNSELIDLNVEMINFYCLIQIFIAPCKKNQFSLTFRITIIIYIVKKLIFCIQFKFLAQFSVNPYLNIFFLTFIHKIFSQISPVTNLQSKQNPLPPNCLQVDSRNRCIQCDGSYMVSNGQCVPLPPNCLEVDSRNRCTKCAQGYSLTNSVCNVIPKITLSANCQKADKRYGCLKCALGYFVATNGLCVKTKPQLPDNCQQTDIRNRCIKCSQHYTALNGQCIINPRTALPANCLQTTNNGKGCVHCTPGYYVSTKYNCVKSTKPWSPPHCAQLDSKNNCLKCTSEYLVINEQCLTDPRPTVPTQCAILTPTLDGCAKCTSDYFLFQGRCISLKYEAPDNCIQVNSENICVKCDEGYDFDSNGICNFKMCSTIFDGQDFRIPCDK